MPGDEGKRKPRTLRRLLSRARPSSAASSSSTSNPPPDPPQIDALPAPPDEHTLADLWDEAFGQYKKSTGVDLQDQNSHIYKRLESCSDYRAVVDVLAKTAEDFELYRHPSSNDIYAKFRKALRPVVRSVLNARLLEAGGEAAASAPGGKSIFVAIEVLLKATQGVSDRFDAVATLLERFEFYMRRLDVRLSAPLEPAAHVVIVKILVEMLHTFATLTQMMNKTRASHFFSVLSGSKDAVAVSTRRLESLEVQDARLTLTEIHGGMRSLSAFLREDLSRLESAVAQMNEHMEEMSYDMAEMSGSLHSSFNVLSRVHTMVVALSEQDKTRHVSHGGQLTTTAEAWRVCMAITYLNATSTLEYLASTMLSGYNDLTPAERTALRKGFAMIYSAAALTAGGNSESAWSAALVNPAAFLHAFLPMALTYVAAFLCWRYIPTFLGQSHSGTIVIIDVLGVHLRLPLGKYSSWADVHALLVDRFENKDGEEYVKSKAYTITDTAGELAIIKPTTWAQAVQSGMTLEMSIVIQQLSHSPKCPCCGYATVQALVGDWIRCKSCMRQYRTLEDVETNITEQISHATELSASGGDSSTSEPTVSRDPPSDSSLQTAAAPDSRRMKDLTLYRRISIELPQDLQPFEALSQGLPPGRQQPPQLFGPMLSARELKGVRPDGSIDFDMHRVTVESITKMKQNIEPQLTSRFQPVDPPVDVERMEWMALLDRVIVLAAEIETTLPTFIAYTQGPHVANTLSKYVGQVMTIQSQKKLLGQHPPRFLVDSNALRGFIQQFSNLLFILRNRIIGVRLELQQLHGAAGPRPPFQLIGHPGLPGQLYMGQARQQLDVLGQQHGVGLPNQPPVMPQGLARVPTPQGMDRVPTPQQTMQALVPTLTQFSPTPHSNSADATPSSLLANFAAQRHKREASEIRLSAAAAGDPRARAPYATSSPTPKVRKEEDGGRAYAGGDDQR